MKSGCVTGEIVVSNFNCVSKCFLLALILSVHVIFQLQRSSHKRGSVYFVKTLLTSSLNLADTSLCAVFALTEQKDALFVR